MKKYLFLTAILTSCSTHIVNHVEKVENYKLYGRDVIAVRKEAEQIYSNETGIKIDFSRIDAITDSLTDNRLK